MLYYEPAELVVKYEHVKDALKEDQPQWGGVFICDDNEEIEKAFAKSEPPAHDDWKPNSTNEISKEQKTFVRSALKNIKKRVNFLNGREKVKMIYHKILKLRRLSSLAFKRTGSINYWKRNNWWYRWIENSK